MCDLTYIHVPALTPTLTLSRSTLFLFIFYEGTQHTCNFFFFLFGSLFLFQFSNFPLRNQTLSHSTPVIYFIGLRFAQFLFFPFDYPFFFDSNLQTTPTYIQFYSLSHLAHRHKQYFLMPGERTTLTIREAVNTYQSTRLRTRVYIHQGNKIYSNYGNYYGKRRRRHCFVWLRKISL